MSEYTPDRWVIIGDGKNFKIFGSWSGGYLGSDSWRLSSGLLEVIQDEENEDILLGKNYSGSVYNLRKTGQGISSAFCASVLNGLLERMNDVDGEERAKIYSLEEYEKAKQDQAL